MGEKLNGLRIELFARVTAILEHGHDPADKPAGEVATVFMWHIPTVRAEVSVSHDFLLDSIERAASDHVAKVLLRQIFAAYVKSGDARMLTDQLQKAWRDAG